MFCRYCGKEIVENARFCSFCGNFVEDKAIDISSPPKKIDLVGIINIIMLLVIIVVGIVLIFFLCNTENVGLDDGMFGRWNLVSQEVLIDEKISSNGNTHANLKNGGWVAEQGDWNYYAIHNSILKENVITGEKVTIIEPSSNYESSFISNLHVMGKWIYFSREDDRKIYRIKTDGTSYDSFSGIFDWDTYNGNLYGIAYETVTASTKKKLFVQADWEAGTYTQLMEIDENIDFIGLENGYAYFSSMQETILSPITSEYTYSYFRISLVGEPKRQCTWTDEYDYQKVSAVGEPYIKDGKIYILYHYRDAIISTNITYEVLCCDFETEEIIFKEIPMLNGTWNFYNEQFVFGGEDIYIAGLDGSKNLLIADDPDDNSLCLAHDKIYYQCRNMYCKVNPDGTGWENITVEAFRTK